MGDRERILDALDSAWGDLQRALASVPESRIEEPGVVGEWSVRDLIGHVATWEQEAIQALRRYLSDGNLKDLATWTNVDGLNASESERKRALSIAQLRGEFEGSHSDLIALLSAFPEDQLAPKEVEGRIRIDAYGHYAEHTGHIRDWLNARSAGAPES